MKIHSMLAALAAAAFAVNASAQTLKPGLWEVTNSMKSSSGELEKARAQAQQQIANMPPEQRKKMEEMMAKHGTQTAPGGPGGAARKMCLTKEMVERNEVPTQRGDCKTTRNERSGNTTRVAFTCANPPSSGEGQYTVMSSEAYASKMTITTTMQGKPETMHIDTSGKWLGADCGSVKPMQRPSAK